MWLRALEQAAGWGVVRTEVTGFLGHRVHRLAASGTGQALTELPKEPNHIQKGE